MAAIERMPPGREMERKTCVDPGASAQQGYVWLGMYTSGESGRSSKQRLRSLEGFGEGILRSAPSGVGVRSSARATHLRRMARPPAVASVGAASSMAAMGAS